MPELLEEYILALREKIRAEEAEETRLRAAADQVLAEAREAGDKRFTPEWVSKVDEAYKDSDAKRGQIAELRSLERRLMERHAGGSTAATTRFGDRPARMRAEEFIARTFVDSEPYKRLRESGALGSSQSRINTEPVPIFDRAELRSWLQKRAAFDESVGGALIPIDQQVFPPVEIPVRQVKLLDMITLAETESDLVKWSLQTLRQDAAASTPFGAPAPEAAFAFQPQNTAVARIPVMLPVTKDQLADQPQTQTLLETQLRSDVERQLEWLILNGTGGGGAGAGAVLGIFNGTLTWTGGSVSILTYARAATGGPAYMPTGGIGLTGPEYELDALHKGITYVRLNLFAEPTSIALHPTTFEVIQLQKDGYGRYLYPVGTEQQTIWGLPTVVTPVMPVGTGLVADLKRAFTLWLRSGLQLYATDGYMDFFARGMVAILAEMRAAGSVQQPRAVCSVTGL